MVTAHLVERYGREEVLRWYFEVWNEPDIEYFHGSEAEYLKLYDYAVAGVRAALPGARVGRTGDDEPEEQSCLWVLEDVSRACGMWGKSAATGGAVPLDFISFHAKGSP